jgi:hypothetical protein
MGQSSNNAENVGDSDQLDRVHELSWGLLDERLNGEEMAELEDLLQNDPTARESYIRCAQLHAELASYFAPAHNSGTAAKSPVLGFLNEAMPNLGLPAAEELK